MTVSIVTRGWREKRVFWTGSGWHADVQKALFLDGYAARDHASTLLGAYLVSHDRESLIDLVFEVRRSEAAA